MEYYYCSYVSNTYDSVCFDRNAIMKQPKSADKNATSNSINKVWALKNLWKRQYM